MFWWWPVRPFHPVPTTIEGRLIILEVWGGRLKHAPIQRRIVLSPPITIPASDAAIREHKYFVRLKLVRALYLTQNTDSEIYESTPGLLFQGAGDIPNDSQMGICSDAYSCASTID